MSSSNAQIKAQQQSPPPLSSSLRDGASTAGVETTRSRRHQKRQQKKLGPPRTTTATRRESASLNELIVRETSWNRWESDQDRRLRRLQLPATARQSNGSASTSKLPILDYPPALLVKVSYVEECKSAARRWLASKEHDADPSVSAQGDGSRDPFVIVPATGGVFPSVPLHPTHRVLPLLSPKGHRDRGAHAEPNDASSSAARVQQKQPA